MFRLGSDNRFTLFTLFREEAGLTLRVPTHGPEDAFGVRVGDVGLIRDMKSRTSRLPCTAPTASGGARIKESGSVPQFPGHGVGHVQHDPETLLPPGVAMGLLVATVAVPRISFESTFQPGAMFPA